MFIKKQDLLDRFSEYEHIKIKCCNCDTETQIIKCGILDSSTKKYCFEHFENDFLNKHFDILIDKFFFCECCHTYIVDILDLSDKTSSEAYIKIFIDILNKSIISFNEQFHANTELESILYNLKKIRDATDAT